MSNPLIPKPLDNIQAIFNKTISIAHIAGGDLYISFTDGSYVKFEATDHQSGFSCEPPIIELDTYIFDYYLEPLVGIGVLKKEDADRITKQREYEEWVEAMTASEKHSREVVERERAEYERLKKMFE